MVASTLHPVILAVPASDQALERREKVVALRRLARSALAHSADFSGIPLDLQALEKGELGAPIPQAGMHWSLSHKEFFVAAVTAPYPVGIDIEMMKPVEEGLYDRIADDTEWALVIDKSPVNFFRFWTAKEAVLKAVGKGMTGLADCRVTRVVDSTDIRLVFGASRWKVVHHWANDNHLLALTTRGEAISWHLIEET